MSNISNVLRRPALGILPVLVLASVGLTACGGSGSASSNPNAAATRTAGASTATSAAGASTPTATRTAGAPPATNATPQATPTTTASSNRPATPSAAHHVTSPGSGAFRSALAKFAACLRHNGVNMPGPNTSGKGPVFSTKGINTKGSQFRTATSKCRGVLAAAFRSARGSG